MKRVELEKGRENWEQVIQSHGITFSITQEEYEETGEFNHYWNEFATYVFTNEEIDAIEQATLDCHDMALETVEFMIEEASKKESPFRFVLPENTLSSYDGIIDYIKYSFDEYKKGNPKFSDLYGRFDFVYSGGDSPIKMLEYNADTPTGLLESSVEQWFWINELFPDYGQFNLIHEMLIDELSSLKRQLNGNIFHGAYSNYDVTGEELLTTMYILDCAQQAGWDVDPSVSLISLETIQANDDYTGFLDHNGNSLKNFFKLYPWEDLLAEDFGPIIYENKLGGIIEPVWKTFISTKAFPAAMYHLFPESEYVLESYVNDDGGMEEYVKKALYGREGDNIDIIANDVNVSRGGDFGWEGYAYQEYFPLPNFKGEKHKNNYAVVGSWTIAGEPAGIGMREADGLITTDYARFVPHIVS